MTTVFQIDKFPAIHFSEVEIVKDKE